MPPKPKNTKEEIAAAAFSIIKADGLSALTARNLGKRLNTSPSSIFTVLPNMEAVKLAARELAMAEFKEYIQDYRDYSPAFKRIGMMMVSYGIHEPELFKLLFMQEHTVDEGFSGTLRDLDDIPAVCMALIQQDYGLTAADSRLLFEQLWTQAYGLGAMCATGVIHLEDSEIGKRLGILFAGLVMLIKSGKAEFVYDDVQPGSTYHEHMVTDLPFRTD